MDRGLGERDSGGGDSSGVDKVKGKVPDGGGAGIKAKWAKRWPAEKNGSFCKLRVVGAWHRLVSLLLPKSVVRGLLKQGFAVFAWWMDNEKKTGTRE